MWRPSSEDDIRFAIDEGLLRETHYLDMKREIEDSRAARTELARDLASFATDGGALLIGVGEEKAARSWTLEPQALKGLAERVEQIATSKIDPPLYVHCAEIPGPDSSQGYLFVEVEPSPEAPHMVDGVYYGRGDTARYRLSDAEVRRLHATRADRSGHVDRILDVEILRDPIPEEIRKHGHLYLVAEPMTAPPELARSLLSRSIQPLQDLIRSAEPKLTEELREAMPTPIYAVHHARRARGVALCVESVLHGRKWKPHENEYEPEQKLFDIEFQESGGIRVLVGRLTAPSRDEKPMTLVLDAIAVAYSLRLVHWAREFSELIGYRGSWAFGLVGVGLDGAVSIKRLNTYGFDVGPIYDADQYRARTSATYSEMVDRPQVVAARLVAALLRGLGTEHVYAADLGEE